MPSCYGHPIIILAASFATAVLLATPFKTESVSHRLPVPSMLRTAEASQDSPEYRFQQEAYHDDKDDSRNVLHTFFFSSPFVSGHPAPEMRIFFCFRKASPYRRRQAGDGEYAPAREEDCPPPLPTGLA